MLQWLLLLFFTPASMGAADVQTPPEYYVGVVAAEAAYTTLLPNTPDKPKPQPIDPNCPTCKGTGRVRSGDDLAWTKCPTCQPLNAAPPVLPLRELPKPQLFKQMPVQSVPSSH